jgi:hypothetical protein
MNISKVCFCFIIAVTVGVFSACSPKKNKEKASSTVNVEPFIAPAGGNVLFDGTSLNGWEITQFGTEGPCMVSEGKLVINMGDGASGVNWTKEFPEINYEVNLEARKTVGNDFFCGLTFPVNDEFCTLIVGGWGGPVIGLSCIDGADAANNETEVLKRFDKNTWYKIKLQVNEERIITWIDGEKLVDFVHQGRELSIRPEVALSKPFGICTWLTTAELKNIWIRKL